MEEYSIWITPSTGSGSSGSSSVLTVEEVDAVKDTRSAATTMTDVQTLLEAFLNMSPRSACFIDEAFSWQNAQVPVLGLRSSGARLSGFLN